MTTIAPEELAERLRAGERPQIIDTRSTWEFGRGRVPGARHVPFWRLLRPAPDLTAGSHPILYCGYGPRAWLAGWALRWSGVHPCYLRGHMSGWYRRRLPVER